jgi:hypothetical protein
MEREGPSLELLLRRLSETPEDFLGEPHINGKGTLHVPAIVGDLCSMLGSPFTDAVLARFGEGAAKKQRNRSSVTLLLCWLLAHDWFVRARPAAAPLLELLENGATELAAQTPSAKFVSDPDRREELARFALARLGYRPAGETQPQAQDRLTSLSASERARVLTAAKQAEQRSREIRAALAKKAAEEAADKWTRE